MDPSLFRVVASACKLLIKKLFQMLINPPGYIAITFLSADALRIMVSRFAFGQGSEHKASIYR
jgi:hypothetical protein